jgi:putative peptidoglycan lipid II flippase
MGLLPRIGWRSTGRDCVRPGRPGHVRNVARLMLPALLGVGVAQMSLLINTQIASHLAPAASAG